MIICSPERSSKCEPHPEKWILSSTWVKYPFAMFWPYGPGKCTRKTSREAMIRMPAAERCMCVRVNGSTVGTDTQRMNTQVLLVTESQELPTSFTRLSPKPAPLCAQGLLSQQLSNTAVCVFYTNRALHEKRKNP